MRFKIEVKKLSRFLDHFIDNYFIRKSLAVPNFLIVGFPSETSTKYLVLKPPFNFMEELEADYNSGFVLQDETRKAYAYELKKGTFNL